MHSYSNHRSDHNYLFFLKIFQFTPHIDKDWNNGKDQCTTVQISKSSPVYGSKEVEVVFFSFIALWHAVRLFQ